MTDSDKRISALDFALRFLNSPADLNEVFRVADQFVSYIDHTVVHKEDRTSSIKWKMASEDPIDFLSQTQLAHPVKGTIPFRPYPFQIDLIRHVNTHARSVVCHARQMGTTTVLSGYALWWATFKPNQNVLMMTNSVSIAQSMRDRLVSMSKTLPENLRPIFIDDGRSLLHFENGSKLAIQRAEACDLEGVNLFILENAAYVSHKIGYDIWSRLHNQQAKIILSSTPNNMEGLFHDILSTASSLDRSGSDFQLLTIPWHLHPERDQAWADTMRQNLGDSFAWTHECQFKNKGI